MQLPGGHTGDTEPSRLLGGRRTRPRGWEARGMAVGEEGWQERLHPDDSS